MSSDNAERTRKLLLLHCNVVQRTLLCAALDQVGGGLTPTQYSGLRFVALHPGACIRDLAKGLQVSHPAAVKLVERLDSRRLVSRTQDKEDQRRVCLRVTAEGQKLFEQVRRRHRALVGRVLEAMGEEQARKLSELLEQFVRTAVTTREEISRVCLYCGVEHTNSCPVGEAEILLTGAPRSEY